MKKAQTFIKREEKNVFQHKLFSNFKNLSNFESEPALGRPRAGSLSKYLESEKKRKSENLVIRKQEIQILINTNF